MPILTQYHIKVSLMRQATLWATIRNGDPADPDFSALGLIIRVAHLVGSSMGPNDIILKGCM